MDESFSDSGLRLQPAATGAALVLFALTLAILYNAFFGQSQFVTAIASPGGAVTKLTVDAGDAPGPVVSVRVDPVVEAVQKELALAGFYDGPIDGVAGKKTRQAIESWQRANAMDVTGVASQEMADQMAFNRTIAEAAGGETGSVDAVSGDAELAKVQIGLLELGYLPGATDGQMTDQTRDAIRQFERDRGLPETGEISPALLQEMAKTSGQSTLVGED
jgi:peptidoglycan hydrolase-like protein with peptidoglycan-binding domain